MLAYTLIHGCDPDKYKPGEIVEMIVVVAEIIPQSSPPDTSVW